MSTVAGWFLDFCEKSKELMEFWMDFLMDFLCEDFRSVVGLPLLWLRFLIETEFNDLSDLIDPVLFNNYLLDSFDKSLIDVIDLPNLLEEPSGDFDETTSSFLPPELYVMSLFDPAFIINPDYVLSTLVVLGNAAISYSLKSIY